MLGNKEFFQGSGKVNRDALAGFIKDIKKNTKLSDEDAAVIAASKVKERRKPESKWTIPCFRSWIPNLNLGCGIGLEQPVIWQVAGRSCHPCGWTIKWDRWVDWLVRGQGGRNPGLAWQDSIFPSDFLCETFQ